MSEEVSEGMDNIKHVRFPEECFITPEGYIEMLPDDGKTINFIVHPQRTKWYVRLWRFITFYKPKFTESNLEKFNKK